jgi:hypothetical protein
MTLWAFAIMVIAGLVFFRFVRGKGSMKIKGPWGLSVETKSEEPKPPATVLQGIQIAGAKAGGNIVTENRGPDGIKLADLDAGKNIHTTNQPDETPPKS